MDDKFLFIFFPVTFITVEGDIVGSTLRVFLRRGLGGWLELGGGVVILSYFTQDEKGGGQGGGYKIFW